MLTAYRQHEAERAALGIPALPLSAQQTADLIELLKAPPAGEEKALVELITYRVPAGVDNMGGSAASRITAGVSGVAGSTLGGTGGNQHAQQDTLSATSVVTDPGHIHTSNAVKAPVATPGVGIAGGAVGYGWNAATIDSASTGITVATTVSSALTGTSQNVPPVAMINFIIYLGA